MKKTITLLLTTAILTSIISVTAEAKVSHPSHHHGKHAHQKSQRHIDVVKITTYDQMFKSVGRKNKYATPRLLKAVCAAESGLSPKARSSKSALGLCQIMPRTWKGVVKTNKSIPKGGAKNPMHSIKAASIVLKGLAASWQTKSTKRVSRDLVLASYNAGFYRVRKATKSCNSLVFSKLKACLPKETVLYVARVNALHKRITI